MKKLMYVMLCVGLGLVLCGTAQANLLLNSSFDTSEFSGACPENWTMAPAYPSATTGAETWAARSGEYGMAAYWWNNSGIGAFYQDVTIVADTDYEFTIYAKRDAGDLAGTVTMTIEWYQGTTLLSTTSLDITTLFGSDGFTLLSLTGTSATGADTARVMISVDSITKAMQFDDASLVAVPEPVTMALFGLGSLFLARRRK